MKQVTGVSVSQAFFDRITGKPSVLASSMMPCAAVLQVRGRAPDRAAKFATAIQEAHFGAGEDLNDPVVYDRAAHALGLELTFALPDPEHVPISLATEFGATLLLGISSYPALIVEAHGRHISLPTNYDAGVVVKQVSNALRIGEV